MKILAFFFYQLLVSLIDFVRGTVWDSFSFICFIFTIYLKFFNLDPSLNKLGLLLSIE